MQPNDPPAISLVELTRHFEQVVAVDHVSLEILDGEFFTLLGPSGSGKTTCLRLIAGFEQPTSGRILLHGQDVTRQPPFERQVNTVFQDYALFPHMTVGENIAYGLMIRGVARADQSRRVGELLELVRMSGLEKRRPSQLSGGQRQRVALARALILHPRVLLLDEPLGALDLKLRQQMQVELKAIQQQVGITFIYVTHDQEEALTMSDRIAIFNRGRVMQIGSPAELYEYPNSPFVAGFVGVSNLIGGALAERITGSPETFSVRPEKISLQDPDHQTASGYCSVQGRVRDVVYLGVHTRYLIELEDGQDLTVIDQNRDTTSMDVLRSRGREVRLEWNRAHNRKVSEGS